MLLNSIRSVRTCGIGAAGKHVRFLYKGDQIWSVSTAGTFDMVSVNCPTLERSCRLFYKSSLVEGVGMKFALYIVLVTDPIKVSYISQGM